MFTDLIYLNIKDMYEIDEFGNIRNKNTGHILKAKEKSNGYMCVGLQTVTGKVRTISVHKLVATHFVNNPDINTKIEVNHKDFNKKNNHYSNLEWVTPKENKLHALNGGHQSYSGENNPSATHSDEIVHGICSLLEKRYTMSDIIYELKLPDTQTTRHFISKIKGGSRWRSISSQYNIPHERLKDNKRYTNAETQAIRNMLFKGLSNDEILKHMGWTKDNVSDYRNRRRFIQEYRQKLKK